MLYELTSYHPNVHDYTSLHPRRLTVSLIFVRLLDDITGSNFPFNCALESIELGFVLGLSVSPATFSESDKKKEELIAHESSLFIVLILRLLSAAVPNDTLRSGTKKGENTNKNHSVCCFRFTKRFVCLSPMISA